MPEVPTGREDKARIIMDEDIRRLEEKLYNDSKNLTVTPLTPIEPELTDVVRRLAAKMAALMVIRVRTMLN